MGNLPSPPATQSSCLPREDTPEAALGCWESQLAKNEYLEFAKPFGSQHEFVARRSLITWGKLPGKVRTGSRLYNCSMKMQQLQKPLYVIRTVGIHVGTDAVNLCLA